MSDLISRQAAIDAFEDTTFTKNEIRRRLSELPSAQPEIVRCKDCICAHSEAWLSGGGKSEGYAYGYCGKTNLKILPYDYCSRGERGTDEAD